VGAVIHTQRFQLSEGHLLPSFCDYVVCEECGFAFSDTPVDQAGYICSGRGRKIPRKKANQLLKAGLRNMQTNLSSDKTIDINTTTAIKK
jgi:hypothetical protein